MAIFSQYGQFLAVLAAMVTGSCQPLTSEDMAEMAEVRFVPEVVPAADLLVRSSTEVLCDDGNTLLTLTFDQDEQAVTRSAPVTSLSEYGSFGLFGYQYASPSPAIVPNLAAGEEVSISSGRGGYFLWGERYKRFWAYAPFTDGGIAVHSVEGAPSFLISVPADVSDHKDILVADSGQLEMQVRGTSEVTLRFGHILAAVRYVIPQGKSPASSWKINTITLGGIACRGVYSCASGTWSYLGGTGSCTLEWNHQFAFMDSMRQFDINPSMMLFLIPQSLGGARIEFDLTVGGSHKVVGASLPDSAALVAGKILTINLDLSHYQ